MSAIKEVYHKEISSIVPDKEIKVTEKGCGILVDLVQKMDRLCTVMSHFGLDEHPSLMAEIASYLFDGLGEDPLKDYADTDREFGRIHRENPSIKDVDILDMILEKEWHKIAQGR